MRINILLTLWPIMSYNCSGKIALKDGYFSSFFLEFKSKHKEVNYRSNNFKITISKYWFISSVWDDFSINFCWKWKILNTINLYQIFRGLICLPIHKFIAWKTSSERTRPLIFQVIFWKIWNKTKTRFFSQSFYIIRLIQKRMYQWYMLLNIM